MLTEPPSEMMPFEPTSNMIYNALRERALIGNTRFGSVELMLFKCVIEAGQKELVEWQEGRCGEHFDDLIARVDCPHCQLAIRKHFGIGGKH